MSSPYVQAMREVLGVLTAGAESASWVDRDAIREVLDRVVESVPRHIVLLPEAANDAWDMVASGVRVDGGEVDGLRFDRGSERPVVFVPRRLTLMATRGGPMLHLEVRELERKRGGVVPGGLLEEVDLVDERCRSSSAECENPHVDRLLGGNVIIAAHGLPLHGRRIADLSHVAWAQLLHMPATEVEALLR